MNRAQQEIRIAELERAIADALAAMDRGEWGQVRRILKTGRDAAPISTTGVIARNSPGAL